MCVLKMFGLEALAMMWAEKETKKKKGFDASLLKTT